MTIIENKDPSHLRYGYPTIDFVNYKWTESFCILKPGSEVVISESIKISNGEVWHKIEKLMKDKNNSQSNEKVSYTITESKTVEKNKQNDGKSLFDKSEHCTHKKVKDELYNMRSKCQKKCQTDKSSDICRECQEQWKKTGLWFIGKYRYDRNSINKDYEKYNDPYKHKWKLVIDIPFIGKFISVKTFYIIYKCVHFFIGIRIALGFYEQWMEECFLTSKRMVALVLISISFMIVISEYSGVLSVVTNIQESQSNQNVIGSFLQGVGFFIFDNSSWLHNISASFLCSMLLLQLFPSPFSVKPRKMKIVLRNKINQGKDEENNDGF